MRKIIVITILIIAILLPSVFVSGSSTNATATQPMDMPAPSTPFSLYGEAVILVEQTTGRILYEENMHRQMFPASTTKLLTALVVMDHLDLDTPVIVGPEIHNMPAGFATGVHVEGEAITVRVLLHALLMRSSNESGRVLALETVRTTTGERGMDYTEAKLRFSTLLNAKARDLGAENSNFNNPYGLHNDFHFSTAYDLSLIALEFARNPILMEIIGTLSFDGDSMEGHAPPYGAESRQLSFRNTNQMLPGAALAHPHITGGRTGFTTPAGHCFIGFAHNGELGLVSVVLKAQEDTRWQDTRALIDYGFQNFGFYELGAEHELVETVFINNPRLGEPETMDVFIQSRASLFLSNNEMESLARAITFSSRFMPEEDEDGNITIRTPIDQGETVGALTYSIGAQTLFSAPISAERQALTRTFDSDMDYYMDLIFSNIFTLRGLPYWLAFFGFAFGIAGTIYGVSMHRRLRRMERWDTIDKRRRY